MGRSKRQRENELEAMGGIKRERAEEIARVAMGCRSAFEKRKEMSKDNLLCQPMREWEKSDLREPGQKQFFFPGERYKQGYAGIDWRA